ncbi:hypothetical protein BJ742DRAFT_858410 [Cladochytrium replicatum]|nr:hypothetical protein BJ742DRAFT_858410 [Cladochytrium replicatum]
MSLEQILDTEEQSAPTPYPISWHSMTLKEKIRQRTQLVTGMLIDPATSELDEERVRKWIKEWGIGSIFDSPANHGGKFINYSAKHFAEFTDKVQKIAVEEGSKKVPVVYGLDSIHGANYVDGVNQ